MLSIIISSYQPSYFSALEKNIAETCGVNYEIIKIENPGLMSICEAYNKGAQISNYKHLLFIHEDILFVENNWGEKLLLLLSLPNCGVVGIAGGDYYSHVPGSWWNKGHKYLHFIQSDKKGNRHFNNRAGFPEDKSIIPVKAIDGVFLACAKKTYDAIKFNEKIKGYHGYDLVFSLEAAKKQTNYVTDQLLVTHFSAGNLSKEWLNNILNVRQIIGTFPEQKKDLQVEMDNYYKLISLLKTYGFTNLESIKIIFKYLNPKFLGIRNCLKVIYRTQFLFR